MNLWKDGTTYHWSLKTIGQWRSYIWDCVCEQKQYLFTQEQGNGRTYIPKWATILFWQQDHEFLYKVSRVNSTPAVSLNHPGHILHRVLLLANVDRCKVNWGKFTLALYQADPLQKKSGKRVGTFRFGNGLVCLNLKWQVPSLTDVYWTLRHCDNWRIKNQLDATCYFIVLLVGSTYFEH
jgi:hypothetical protein